MGQYQLKEDTIDWISVVYIKPLNTTSAVFLYHRSESQQTVYPGWSITLTCTCKISWNLLLIDSEGGIPPDGTPVTVVITFHLGLVIPFYIIAMAGLIFGTICLIFTYTQRKKK